MSRVRNTLISLAVSVAGRQVLNSIASRGLDQVLRPIGLTRRQSQWPANLAYVGLGVVLGGVTGLLLAPPSEERRHARLTRKAEWLAQAARKARRLSEELQAEIKAAYPPTGNGQDGGPAHEPT
jgi:hypothetical protein